jgi:hypothetical protein
MSLPLATALVLLTGGIVGLLLYYFPRWVPRRLPRFRKPNWAWKRPHWTWKWPDWKSWFKWRRKDRDKPGDEAETAVDIGEEELPDLPVEAFVSLADRFAAEGRYAEAIRERLRGIVRDLVDRGVIEHHPGWTVTELAGAAGAVLPALGRPLGAAVNLFSEIWYGERPARAEHDTYMRELVDQVTAALGRPVGVPA